MRKFATALAAVSLLTACSPTTRSTVTGPGPVTATTAGDTVRVHGHRALLVAHNSYQGAAAAAELAVKSGKLSDEDLARLQELNNKAYAFLTRADTGLSVADRAAEIMNITVEMLAITRGAQ